MSFMSSWFRIFHSLFSSSTLELVPRRMVLVLHQSGVPHGHSHGTHRHQRQGRCNHENASVRAAFVHVLGDLVQSVGVLVAAAIIHFWVRMGGTFRKMAA